MKKKKTHKDKLKILLIVLMAVLSIFSIQNVTADSGFDTDYGGSSYDSSYSDSDWENSSSSSPLSVVLLIIEIIFYVFAGIIGFIVLCYQIRDTINGAKYHKELEKSGNASTLNHDREVSKKEIKDMLPNYDKDKFIKERFDDFVKIQNAWTDFDYDALRNMLTDELYNQYEMQLETLKENKEVNEMNSFKLKDAMITNITDENDKIAVTMEFVVSFHDYIKKGIRTVRGSSMERVLQHYEMTFVCNKKDKIDTCPNCGAKLTNSSSQKCKYCGSVISRVSNKFVLAKKESIWQGIDL